MADLNSDKSSSDHPYRPVACDFVDLIEHYATLSTPIEVRFLNAESSIIEPSLVIQTWENDGNAEYVIFKNGLRVRMDHIQELAGQKPDGDCKI